MRNRFLPHLLLLALLPAIASCAVPGLKTSAAARFAALPEPDSLRILNGAKEDQRNFEILRRSRMILYNTPTVYPECGTFIGRYCVEIPLAGLARIGELPEDPDVIRARAVLVEGLDLAASRLPGDRWIQGQRVRYLVEAGEMERAIAVAEGCEVDPLWWCMALLGYALHRADRPVEAESAFRLTLASMEPGERAAWLSPYLVLDEESRARLEELTPEEEAEAGARFWLLADPFWTREGNEIFGEHLTRWIETDLRLDSEITEGTDWRADLIEATVRYGIDGDWIRAVGAEARESKVRWTAGEIDRLSQFDGVGAALLTADVFAGGGALMNDGGSSIGAEFGPPTDDPDPIRRWAPPRGVRDIVLRTRFPGVRLLPPAAAILSGEVAHGRWDLEESFPWAAYNFTRDGRPLAWLTQLAHQLATFPRGDSAVIVVGYDLPAHGIGAEVRVEGGLALLPAAPGEGGTRGVRSDQLRATGVLALTAGAVPSYLSLELLLPDEGVAGRARYGVDLAPPPTGVPTLSDLLLHRGGVTPNSLSEAAGIALPSNRIAPGEEIGIYWELHGLDFVEVEAVSMSLALHPPPQGGVLAGIRWLGEALRIVDEPRPIRTVWTEEVDVGSFMGRSIGFRIPEGREGRYLIEMRAELPGREPIVALREVEVTRSTIPSPRPITIMRRPHLIRIVAFGHEEAMVCPVPADLAMFGHYGGVCHLSHWGYDGW